MLLPRIPACFSLPRSFDLLDSVVAKLYYSSLPIQPPGCLGCSREVEPQRGSDGYGEGCITTLAARWLSEPLQALPQLLSL
jgi:hypothetical protein